MNMIRVLLVGLCLIWSGASFASAQTRDIYTVRDIEVEEQADTVIQAQQKAFAAARIQGLYRLIDRLTLSEDRAGKMPAEGLDIALAERLAAAVDVEEETRGGGRYVGKLAVVYNPSGVRNFLEMQDIPYIDQPAPKAVIFPISTLPGRRPVERRVEQSAPSLETGSMNPAEEEEKAVPLTWEEAWPDQSQGRLAPFVTARPDPEMLSIDSQWFELKPQVDAAAARRAVKAILNGREGRYWVDVISVTASGEVSLGNTGYVSTLEQAVDAAAEVMDQVWKEQSIIRSDERTPARATIFFTSLPEWNSLRTALARSPLISDFAIEGLSRDGAVVKFVYAGEEQRLISNLRERGVTLDPDLMGWVMTSAVSQAPALSEE